MQQIKVKLRLFTFLLSTSIGLSQNTSSLDNIKIKSMTNENDTFENSIYAIISLPIKVVDSLENNFEYPAVIHGINGTCFFITPNKFITAYHVINKFYAEKQIYFLINKNGDIISGIQIEQEVPENDLCVGKIESQVDPYYKIPTSSPTLKQGEIFIAYGFSSNDTQNFNIKIIKENNRVRLIRHDALELKKIEYTFIQQEMLNDYFSKDEIPINLKKCNVLLFDTSLELGFSGGPTFNKETSEVVGFASQDAFNSGTPLMLIIPLSGN